MPLPPPPPSSPRTRGSSGNGFPGPVTDGVVPAHAGVLRSSSAASRSASCRPRARGGPPYLGLLRIPWDGSSPRTRGSSHRHLPRADRRRVVPAHAGVLRGSRWPPTAPGRRPRAREGPPDNLATRMTTAQSSPRTRGSSEVRVHVVLVVQVVPAHAGVLPRTGRWSRRRRRRPRARGGPPGTVIADLAWLRSSPHSRGSSRDVDRRGRRRGVVPALAGVLPRRGAGSSRMAGRPRARGGPP